MMTLACYFPDTILVAGIDNPSHFLSVGYRIDPFIETHGYNYICKTMFGQAFDALMRSAAFSARAMTGPAYIIGLERHMQLDYRCDVPYVH